MDSVPKHRCFQLCARKVHILDSDSESQPDASSKQLSVRESELDSGDEPDVVVVLDSAAPSGPTVEATRAGSDVAVKSPSDVDAAEIASDEQSSDGGSLARGAVDADGVAEASVALPGDASEEDVPVSSDSAASTESSTSHWSPFMDIRAAFVIAARRIGWDVDESTLEPPPLYNVHFEGEAQ